MERRGVHWSALWGVFGVILLLADALWRLAPRAYEALTGELTTLEWLSLIPVLGFFGIAEGYKGFQQAFSPRVAVRAMCARDRGLAAQLLAPLFCMTLFDTPRRRLLISWGLVIMIVGLIIGVSYLPQPWRGIVDAGVVVGLGWGVIATVVMFAKALRGTLGTDPELGER